MTESKYRLESGRWPAAFGGPCGRAVLKQQAEDFRVTELLDIQPEGEGEHVWLHLEKRGMNTGWLARLIAKLAGVRHFDVGFAGIKDRHAVTRQWFSVYLPKGEEPHWQSLESMAEQEKGEHIRVLQATRHLRKLKRGSHRANRFRLVLRQLEADRGELKSRLHQIAQHGVPNYFGPQRFGRHGDNVQQFLDQAAKGTRALGKKDMLISAARSWLFNELLARRVADGSWNQARVGDQLMLAGSQSHFLCQEVDDSIQRRILSMDVHPSGPLWGQGELSSAGQVLAVEQQVGEACSELTDVLQALKLKQERRSLRLPVVEPDFLFQGEELHLGFELGRGAYATSVLAELVSPLDKPQGTA